ncbi:MAG: DUF86 domain-containing protein [Anaerolineae bacterium]|nr:DUF86 domain-containing protein [Anaerolineae bacterium]MDW8072163.1 DUF86 domain-containing protein [Anaerolineae bacterium]
MSRDIRLYLEDIIEACEKILRYTREMSFAQFAADERTLDAVARNLEIIGEAARHIPEEIRQRYGEVEWAKIVALRNVVAHKYFGVDEEILWDIIQNKVPHLLEHVQHILDAQR